MKLYQPIYKEYGRLDADFNEAPATNIYKTELEAWQSFIADCETDEDIAYVIKLAARGQFGVKEVHYEPEGHDECQDIMWTIEVRGYGIQEPGCIFKTEEDALGWVGKAYGKKAIDYLNDEAILITPITIYTGEEDD